MLRRRARFRGLQYASFNAFLEEGKRRHRTRPSSRVSPDSGIPLLLSDRLPQGGGGHSEMDIFADADVLLSDSSTGAGKKQSAPGRMNAAGERPLRAAASSPGPTDHPEQHSREKLMTVDRLAYATVVTFTTPSLREAHAAQLGPELISLARLTGGRLALDMSQVTDFSCAWINAMIAAARQCEQFGGKLAIMALSPKLEGLLRETGLHRQLYLAGSVKEALQRFANSAERESSSSLARWFGLKRGDAA